MHTGVIRPQEVLLRRQHQQSLLQPLTFDKAEGFIADYAQKIKGIFPSESYSLSPELWNFLNQHARKLPADFRDAAELHLSYLRCFLGTDGGTKLAASTWSAAQLQAEPAAANLIRAQQNIIAKILDAYYFGKLYAKNGDSPFAQDLLAVLLSPTAQVVAAHQKQLRNMKSTRQGSTVFNGQGKWGSRFGGRGGGATGGVPRSGGANQKQQKAQTCYACRKTGHIAKDCPTKKASSNNQYSGKKAN